MIELGSSFIARTKSRIFPWLTRSGPRCFVRVVDLACVDVRRTFPVCASAPIYCVGWKVFRERSIYGGRDPCIWFCARHPRLHVPGLGSQFAVVKNEISD